MEITIKDEETELTVCFKKDNLSINVGKANFFETVTALTKANNVVEHILTLLIAEKTSN